MVRSVRLPYVHAVLTSHPVGLKTSNSTRKGDMSQRSRSLSLQNIAWMGVTRVGFNEEYRYRLGVKLKRSRGKLSFLLTDVSGSSIVNAIHAIA